MSRSRASARRPRAASWSRCCCRRSSRHAKRPAAPSASTTSSRSAWRCSTMQAQPAPSPGPPITDKQGKPLLSWRVAILPYIEQQGLYQKFKLDEPWDSPHNQALLKEMPSTYVCPSRAQVEPFTTTYQVFTGKGAVRERPGHEDRRHHRRDVQHADGRRGQEGGSLDQARRPAVRPGGGSLALRGRIVPPRRLQRLDGRRLGAVLQDSRSI